jgi:hypothetical protein
VNDEKYDRKYQKQMNATGGDMERKPGYQPDNDKEKENNQKNEVCEKSHRFSGSGPVNCVQGKYH